MNSFILKSGSLLAATTLLLSGCYSVKDTVSHEPSKLENTRKVVSESYSTTLVKAPTENDQDVIIEVNKVTTYSYDTEVVTDQILEKDKQTKALGVIGMVIGGGALTVNTLNNKQDEGDKWFDEGQVGSVGPILTGVGVVGVAGGIACLVLPKERTKSSTLPGEPMQEEEVVPVTNQPVEILTWNGESASFTTDADGKLTFNVGTDYVHDGLDYDTEMPLTLTMESAALPTDIALNSADWMEVPEVAEVAYRGGGDPLKGLNVSGSSDEMIIGNYYALIIGIDSYTGEWMPLDNAVNDAQAVEELLKDKYKFDAFHTLYNDDATRASIITELEWLVENVQPEDNVFIYYSGHGQYKESLNKGYWVPADATANSTAQFISNSDLQTFLGGIKSNHTLLVSDACFSGDIFRGNTISVPFEDSEKYYTEVHNLSSRQAISSGGIEPVMDGGEDGHSVFAYYFLKALRNNDAKFFDASQVYDSIKIPVTNNSEQSPQFQSVKNTGDEGGQFIFISKDGLEDN